MLEVLGLVVVYVAFVSVIWVTRFLIRGKQNDELCDSQNL